MRTMCGAVLGFESVVLLLTIPVLITVADVDVALALAAGLGLAVACVVAAASLRQPHGYQIGHLVQVGAIGMGALTPVMYFLGAVFAGLWVLAYVLGRRIEAAKAARTDSTGEPR
jgi:Protein of unknown function (DUF4233)